MRYDEVRINLFTLVAFWFTELNRLVGRAILSCRTDIWDGAVENVDGFSPKLVCRFLFTLVGETMRGKERDT